MLSGCGVSISLISHAVTSNSQPVGKAPVWRHMLVRPSMSIINISLSETMAGLRDFLGPNRELGNFMGQIIRICCLLARKFVAAPFYICPKNLADLFTPLRQVCKPLGRNNCFN